MADGTARSRLAAIDCFVASRILDLVSVADGLEPSPRGCVFTPVDQPESGFC